MDFLTIEKNRMQRQRHQFQCSHLRPAANVESTSDDNFSAAISVQIRPSRWDLWIFNLLKNQRRLLASTSPVSVAISGYLHRRHLVRFQPCRKLRMTASLAYGGRDSSSSKICSEQIPVRPNPIFGGATITLVPIFVAGEQWKFKKGKSMSLSMSWSFNDPELQRNKRVASYKAYTVEGKVKGSFKKSFRWLKDRYTRIIYGHSIFHITIKIMYRNISTPFYHKRTTSSSMNCYFYNVGSFAIFVLRHRDMVKGTDGDLKHIAQVIALNMTIGLVSQGIDNWGHVGGLVGGATVSWLLGPAWEVESISRDGRRTIKDKAPIFSLIKRHPK
ncbi:hypothetical protein BUALT_Bualt15G0134600 [Buddleja alternifolia]|uniref:Peptidase S54 rhomboid domain-containing protein n=1 Tax=Buddleja alternifolia TaxID=168488 RepID=A0AAV6WFH0_9LAMI|nr:hypothetical protein BUALT_Bualt15G0134600 [Buddleja alternifolia]